MVVLGIHNVYLKYISTHKFMLKNTEEYMYMFYSQPRQLTTPMDVPERRTFALQVSALTTRLLGLL